jgi:hypothetical protein
MTTTAQTSAAGKPGNESKSFYKSLSSKELKLKPLNIKGILCSGLLLFKTDSGKFLPGYIYYVTAPASIAHRSFEKGDFFASSFEGEHFDDVTGWAYIPKN